MKVKSAAWPILYIHTYIFIVLPEKGFSAAIFKIFWSLALTDVECTIDRRRVHYWSLALTDAIKARNKQAAIY